MTIYGRIHLQTSLLTEKIRTNAGILNLIILWKIKTIASWYYILISSSSEIYLEITKHVDLYLINKNLKKKNNLSEVETSFSDIVITVRVVQNKKI